MGYHQRIGFVAVLVASLATGCAQNSGGISCPAFCGGERIVTPTPTPSATPTPGEATETVALPVAGALVTFPEYQGASGEFVLPSYEAPPGTKATFATTLAAGAGPAPASRRRRDASSATTPAAVMSLQMTFSQTVVLSELPITVFSPPPGSPTSPYAAELYDVQAGGLITAAAQAEAPAGVIAFSPFSTTGTLANGAITLSAGREYSLELVLDPALTLPAPGLACGPPPPVADIPLDLAYPLPSSTGVSTALGNVILQGGVSDDFGPTTISVASVSGTSVVSGVTPTTAPSPLPSPIAMPVFSAPYYAVAVPALSAQTQYVVTKTSYDYANVPPLCVASATSAIGSFTTGN